MATSMTHKHKETHSVDAVHSDTPTPKLVLGKLGFIVFLIGPSVLFHTLQQFILYTWPLLFGSTVLYVLLMTLS